MKKILLLIAMMFLLTSCQDTDKKTNEYSNSYVPKDKWEGLETREYPCYDDVIQAYVLAYEKTGTPDPQPKEDAGVNSENFQVVCKTTETTYSLANLDLVTVEVTNIKSGNNTAQNDIQLHYHLNIERWNGVNWERLLFIPRHLYTNVESQVQQTVSVGETAKETLATKNIITALTPGKYRLVAYVNYQPVYAEFELTE